MVGETIRIFTLMRIAFIILCAFFIPHLFLKDDALLTFNSKETTSCSKRLRILLFNDTSLKNISCVLAAFLQQIHYNKDSALVYALADKVKICHRPT